MISVVMACLNEAKTIGEALESLLAQRVDFPWEIILADNGSTDGSREIFLDWAARRPDVPMRIADASAIRGKSHALNVGIAAAQGDRFVFLDADDTAAPGWLAAMAAALDRCDFVAARTDVATLNPHWALASRPNPQAKGLPVLNYGPCCRHAGGSTLGLHRRVFEAVGAFDTTVACLEDTDFCIRASLAGFDLQFVPEAVYNYRFRTEPEAMRRQAYNYARYRVFLRRRYAAPSWRFAPLPWLSLGLEGASLALLWATRRGASDPEKVGWYERRVGRLQGYVAGSFAFGAAPPSLGFGALAKRLQRLKGQVRNRVAAPFCGATLSVATREKLMALTFDDGPDPESTPALLEVLAAAGARATFFVVGASAARHPELIARIRAEGHEIGNHSWDHPSLPSLPPAEVEAQLRRTDEALAPHAVALMRPPYGHQDFRVNRIARKLGHRVVIWSVSGGDWSGEAADVLAGRILGKAAPGAIVLLHDSLCDAAQESFRDRGPTIDAVAQVIAGLPDYRFVTVSELLAKGSAVERVRFRGAAAGAGGAGARGRRIAPPIVGAGEAGLLGPAPAAVFAVQPAPVAAAGASPQGRDGPKEI